MNDLRNHRSLWLTVAVLTLAAVAAANAAKPVSLLVAGDGLFGGGGGPTATLGLKEGAVTSSHVQDSTIQLADISQQVKSGITGPAGPRGPKGPKGDRGPQGVTGRTGAAGPEGEAGLQGPKGAKGDVGAKGETGEAGPMGEASLSGLIDYTRELRVGSTGANIDTSFRLLKPALVRFTVNATAVSLSTAEFRARLLFFAGGSSVIGDLTRPTFIKQGEAGSMTGILTAQLPPGNYVAQVFLTGPGDWQVQGDLEMHGPP